MTKLLSYTIHFQAPIEHVYHAMATKSGWIEWFGLKAVGFVSEDSVLQIHTRTYHNFLLHFTSLKKNKSVIFKLIDMNSYQMADVSIELSGKHQDVTVQINIDAEDKAMAETLAPIWETSITSLKPVVESGEELVPWNRPFLGIIIERWITPELAKEKDLPIDHGILLNAVVEGGGARDAGIGNTDIIAIIDGIKVHNYDDITTVFAKNKIGDDVPVTFYHDGEPLETNLTLRKYPAPKIPANTQDLADELRAFFEKLNIKIEQLLKGKTEAQLDFRPDGHEWNAKQIAAHIIADYTDTFEWMGSYITGQPVYAMTSTHPARIRSILAAYPSLPELLAAFKTRQIELLAYINALPAEVSNRKSSLAMLSFHLLGEFKMHHLDHYRQFESTLNQAADIRGS